MGEAKSKEIKTTTQVRTSEGAAARNSVRHRWSYVVRDPGTYVGTYRCHRDPRTYARHPPWMGVVLSTTVSNGSVHTQAERMMACRESIKRWQSSPKHYLPMQPRWLWSPFKGGLRDDFCGLGNPPPYSNTVQLPSCLLHNPPSSALSTN